MAFQQVTVENRVSEFPNRRTLTKEDNTTEIVTVTRNEGKVSTEGTAWGAAYANDLESRINTETNLLETNFGHVETNTTASKSYSVGEALVLNGQMYKVTAAIAQGATLTVGTNIAVHSVSAINSNLGGLSFVKDADGKWGYKVAGADPVIPFKGYEKIASSVSGSSINVSAYPGYQNFTTDNFIVEKLDCTALAPGGAIGAGANNINLIMSSTKSYNPSTGVFTFTASTTMQAYAYSEPASTYPTNPVNLLCNVYLIR